MRRGDQSAAVAGDDLSASGPVPVIIAPGSSLGRAVYDQLREWSAAGMIGNLLWVIAHDIHAGGPLSDLHANLLVRGVARRTSLQGYLTRTDTSERLCLAVLSVLDRDEQPLDQVAHSVIREAVSALPTHPRVSPVHCIAVRHGHGSWDPATVWHGWHNLVISPEDGWSPDAAPQRLDSTTTKESFAAHTAAGLAALTGAWSGMPSSPLDEDPTPTGTSVRLARAFVRRIDARNASTALQQRLLDTSRGLPHPWRGPRMVEYADQPGAAAREVAGTVLTRHSTLLAPNLTALPRQQLDVARIDSSQALSLFPSFLIAALRNAPDAWLTNRDSGVSAEAAERMQAEVYQAHQVDFDLVVQGTGSGQVPAHLDDISAAVERLHTSLGRGDAAREEVPDTGEFWRDVARGALTLGDGASHGPGIEPVIVSENPRVVQDPQLICPAVSAPVEVPDELVAELGTQRIESHDIWGFKRAILRAQRLARPGSPASAGASSLREQMVSVADPLQGSYMGILGERLGATIELTAHELAAQLDRLEGATRVPEPPPEVATTAEKVARTLRLYTVVWLGASVLVALLAWAGVLPLLVPLALLVVLLLGWGLMSWKAFQKFAQEELPKRTPRVTSDDELAGIRSNIVGATRAVRVAITLYRQYLAWAPLIGAFVTSPHGPSRVEQPPPAVGRLPRSVGLGVARASTEAVRTVRDGLAMELYPLGWMGPLWDRLLQDLAGTVEDPSAGAGGTDALYDDRVLGPGSPLRTVSELVRTHGTGHGAGAEAWATVRARLNAQHGELMHGTLLATVELVGQQGVPTSLRADEFFSGLVTPTGLTRSTFHPDALTEAARKVGLSAVERSTLVAPALLAADHLHDHDTLRVLEAVTDVDDLSEVAVLLQVSWPLHPDQVAVQAGQAAPRRQQAPTQVHTDDDASTQLFADLAERLRQEREGS